MLSVTSVVEDIRVLTHKMTSQKGIFAKTKQLPYGDSIPCIFAC